MDDDYGVYGQGCPGPFPFLACSLTYSFVLGLGGRTVEMPQSYGQAAYPTKYPNARQNICIKHIYPSNDA